MDTLRGMARMQVVPVLEEVLVLSGETQAQLGKRIGVSQTTISRWMSGETEPTKSQWDIIIDMYFSLKGWRSVDDQIAPFDRDFQDGVRRIINEMIKLQGPPKRR